MLKVNRTKIRKMCEICSRLNKKTPERLQLRCSDVFIVNFEHISSVSVIDFEQVNIWWVKKNVKSLLKQFFFLKTRKLFEAIEAPQQ